MASVSCVRISLGMRGPAKDSVENGGCHRFDVPLYIKDTPRPAIVETSISNICLPSDFMIIYPVLRAQCNCVLRQNADHSWPCKAILYTACIHLYDARWNLTGFLETLSRKRRMVEGTVIQLPHFSVSNLAENYSFDS